MFGGFLPSSLRRSGLHILIIMSSIISAIMPALLVLLRAKTSCIFEVVDFQNWISILLQLFGRF
jgi:hypothetical protein